MVHFQIIPRDFTSERSYAAHSSKEVTAYLDNDITQAARPYHYLSHLVYMHSVHTQAIPAIMLLSNNDKSMFNSIDVTRKVTVNRTESFMKFMKFSN